MHSYSNTLHVSSIKIWVNYQNNCKIYTNPNFDFIIKNIRSLWTYFIQYCKTVFFNILSISDLHDWAPQGLLQPLHLVPVLLPRSNPHPQWAAIEVVVVQVPHGTLGGFDILVLTEAITFWLPCFSVID